MLIAKEEIVGVVVYDAEAPRFEVGMHFKVVGKEVTGSKRHLTRIILQRVNTGGAPKKGE